MPERFSGFTIRNTPIIAIKRADILSFLIFSFRIRGEASIT
jgi:hypothetical protein